MSYFFENKEVSQYFSSDKESQCFRTLADFVYARGAVISNSEIRVISEVIEDTNILYNDKCFLIQSYLEEHNPHTKRIVREYVELREKEVYEEGIIDFMNGIINFFSNVITDIINGIINYTRKNWNTDPKARKTINESRKWIMDLDSDDRELRSDAVEKLNSFTLPVDGDQYELPEAIARLFINNYKLVAKECLEKLEGMKERILADYDTLTDEQKKNIPLSLVSKILNSLDKDVKTHLRNAGVDNKYWPADYVNMIGVYLDTKRAERKNYRNLRELSRNKLKMFLSEALNIKTTEAEVLSKHIFSDVNTFISQKIDTIDKEILEDIEGKSNIDDLGKEERISDEQPQSEHTAETQKKKQSKFGPLTSIMENIDPEYAEMFLRDWRRFDVTFKTAKETFNYDDRTNRSIKIIIACFLTIPYIYKTKKRTVALKAMNRFISTVVKQMYNIYKGGGYDK